MNDLFVYGTLLYSDIQLKVINRIVQGNAAVLHNYKRFQVMQHSYPGIIKHQDSIVEGVIIQVNDEEMLLLDDYEGEEYERISVTVMSKMEMISVSAYIYLFPDKLDGDFHLQMDRLPFNKIVASGPVSILPVNIKLLKVYNENKILYTFPSSSMSTKYTNIEFIDAEHSPNPIVNPWSYFKPSEITKSTFILYFTKSKNLFLNTEDMLQLGCKNNDYVQLTLTHTTTYLQVIHNNQLPINGIKLPNYFSDFVISNSPISLLKIEHYPISTIHLSIITPIEAFELELIKSNLINLIISHFNALVPIFINNKVYYLKWTAIYPNTEHAKYYQISKSTKIVISSSNEIEPFFKLIKNSPFTRTLHESRYTSMIINVVQDTPDGRLNFILRHLKYTPLNFLVCDLTSVVTLNNVKDMVELCKSVNKTLILQCGTVESTDLTKMDILKYLHLALQKDISVIISSQDCTILTKFGLTCHFTTRIDQYNEELIKRIQMKSPFAIPKSIAFLSCDELKYLEYKCHSRMISGILFGKRNLYDFEICHFDQTSLELELKSILKSKTKIPKVYWNDIGGLEAFKAKIINIVELPLRFPELFINKPCPNILLYGPPGCGKTLVAKAIATECELNFKSIKGPELLNQYIGESELNIRLLFEEAKMLRPCVLFFDEIDALAPKRGIHGDSSGVMDRLVSQLLGELDQCGTNGIIVIGATNRPDLLDNALLRPGRFDSLIYLGPCDDFKTVKLILNAQLSKYMDNMYYDMDPIIHKIPLPVTGADLFGFTATAIEHAIDRMIKNNIDDALQLMQVDFEYALDSFNPSLSKAEMEKYGELKELER